MVSALANVLSSLAQQTAAKQASGSSLSASAQSPTEVSSDPFSPSLLRTIHDEFVRETGIVSITFVDISVLMD